MSLNSWYRDVNTRYSYWAADRRSQEELEAALREPDRQDPDKRLSVASPELSPHPLAR